MEPQNQPVKEPAIGLHELVLESLEDDKAVDMVSINLLGKTMFADAMVIATGRSDRHIGSIASNLIKRLKAAGFGPVHVEGLRQGDWVLVDAGDVIIHLFRREVREFYNLEKMWSVDTSSQVGLERAGEIPGRAAV